MVPESPLFLLFSLSKIDYYSALQHHDSNLLFSKLISDIHEAPVPDPERILTCCHSCAIIPTAALQ